MRTLTIISLLTVFIQACDRPVLRPKGSDQEWQQRQEQQEDRQELDQEQLIDERNREVDATPNEQAS